MYLQLSESMGHAMAETPAGVARALLTLYKSGLGSDRPPFWFTPKKGKSDIFQFSMHHSGLETT